MYQNLGYLKIQHKKIIKDTEDIPGKEMFIHIAIQEKFTQVFG